MSSMSAAKSPYTAIDPDDRECPSDDSGHRAGSLFSNIFSKSFSVDKGTATTANVQRRSSSGSNGAVGTAKTDEAQREVIEQNVLKPPQNSTPSTCLFSSNGFWEMRDNILSGISSRLEAALQSTGAGGDGPLVARPTNEPGTPSNRAKALKDRSVFGQPEITHVVDKAHPLRFRKELSRESLDTLDSGHRSMGSSRTSMNELNGFESYDPLNAYRPSTGSVGIGSSLTSSMESSEAEESTLEESVATYSRSESQESVRSAGSTWSSSSDDSQAEAASGNLISKTFMQQFVKNIFDAESDISMEEKSSFGELSRSEEGRLWFARYINSQRANHKQVNEKSFYSLIQYFAITLFECAEADDFSPAKTLMNMCFTFYYQPGPRQAKQYLNQYLREQPIWRSLRFWNAAFFDAVQCERANCPTPSGRRLQKQTRQEIDDEAVFQKNITFGQLGTFTYNLKEFGLSRQFCLEFLRKQSTIANLPTEQVQLLRENIDCLYQRSA